MKTFQVKLLTHGCLVTEGDDGVAPAVEGTGAWGSPAPAPKPAMPMPPMAPGSYVPLPVYPINYAFSTIGEATDFIRNKVESEKE